MHDSNGHWVGYGVGDSGPIVVKIQHRLIFAYPGNSHAVSLGVRETGVYDDATEQAVRNVQPHFNPALPATGIADAATQYALGAVPRPPVKKRFRQQGVGYLAEGFLQPDPAVSYNMSRDGGVAELLRLMLADPGPKVPIGYSQGADVVGHALFRWPVERRSEIKGVVTFGDPCKPPGPTAFGNDPGGAGISGVYQPDWVRDRYWTFTLPGDMYPNSVGLLPQLYDVLTRMAATTDFAMYLFSMLMNSVLAFPLLGLGSGGGFSVGAPGFGALAPILGMITPGPVSQTTGPINLFAMITNIPAIVQTLMAALQFLFTNAHQHYEDQPQPFWQGLTAVDCAAQVVAENVREATVYTVAGTWAGWNDGPPAHVAWQLAVL